VKSATSSRIDLEAITKRDAFVDLVEIDQTVPQIGASASALRIVLCAHAVADGHDALR